MANPKLQSDWAELLASLGFSAEQVSGEFARIETSYSQADRYYHNLDHVKDVLAVAQLAGHSSNRPAILLAAWFHDIIYDSQRSDNESRSAEHAVEFLRQGPVPEMLVDAVHAMILATRDHQATGEDCQILLDADLAILGAPAAAYARYAQAIRQEYAWVPEDRYRQGRKAVLETFLQRAWIFGTAQMRVERESQARINLQEEIASLVKL